LQTKEIENAMQQCFLGPNWLVTKIEKDR